MPLYPKHRKSRPAGVPQTPFDPSTGCYFPIVKPEPVKARVLLVTNRTDGNLLDCKLLDNDGNEGEEVVVARPDDLRADFYVGTWNGIAYTMTDQDTREADDGSTTETQVVTPDYVEDKTILWAERLAGGVGITDPDNSDIPVLWIDATPGRAWAVE